MARSGFWYGENRSGRRERWNVGDLIRYDDGPTALMRIEVVYPSGTGDIAKSVGYYGRAFHSSGACTLSYHGKCLEPSAEDVARWRKCHDANDHWIRGEWG